MDSSRAERSRAHWRSNRRAMVVLLVVWFTVPYLLGIVFVEPLNRFHLGGFPLGFWFAQQGAIYVFVALIAIYAVWMDRIDARFEVDPDTDDRNRKRSQAARGEPQASEAIE
jgi:putative solute:sodium symporter small subunit